VILKAKKKSKKKSANIYSGRGRCKSRNDFAADPEYISTKMCTAQLKVWATGVT
jgi:hypothetical protein